MTTTQAHHTMDAQLSRSQGSHQRAHEKTLTPRAATANTSTTFKWHTKKTVLSPNSHRGNGGNNITAATAATTHATKEEGAKRRENSHCLHHASFPTSSLPTEQRIQAQDVHSETAWSKSSNDSGSNSHNNNNNTGLTHQQRVRRGQGSGGSSNDQRRQR